MSSIIISVLSAVGKSLIKPISNRAKRVPGIRRGLNRFKIDTATAASGFDDMYQRAFSEYEKGKPDALRKFFQDSEVREVFHEAFATRERTYFYEQCWKRVRYRIERVSDSIDYDPRREYDAFFVIFDKLVKQSRTPWQETQERRLEDTLNVMSGMQSDLSGLLKQEETERQLSMPFVTAREFFAPWLNRAHSFNHLPTLIGRMDYLKQMDDFVLDKYSSILVLTGRGGIGKSKILHEFSTNREHPSHTIRFVSDTIPVKPEHFAVLMHGEFVLILDDAHKLDNDSLKLLLSFPQKSMRRIKLVLSSRPQGKDFIEFSLSQAGVDLREVQFLPELTELPLDDVKQLASQVLGKELAYLTDRLSYLTQDCPLVTVVGGSLLRDHAVDPALLEQDQDFRYRVLNRFHDEQVGKISEHIDANACRRLLDLISAVAPVRINRPEFVDKASEFVGISTQEFITVTDELQASGILLRRGWLYRITPDVLSDHILYRACITHNGDPSPYANLVYEEFRDVCGERILRNLSELDWRMTRVQGQESGLLDRVWSDLETKFRHGGIWERIEILQQVQHVACYQAKRSVALAEYAIRHPLPDESAYRTNQQVIDEAAVVLKYVAYSVDYFPHALDLLWEIGRNDGRTTNNNQQHGMRILADIASYSQHKGVFVQEMVLNAVERWLRQPDTQTYLHSPVELLAAVFSKVGEDTHSEGKQVVMTPFLVSEEATRGVRQHAIDLLKTCIESEDPTVAVPAIHVIQEALRKPFPILNIEIPDDYIELWLPQSLSILDFLHDRLKSKPNPYVCIAICEAVSWDAQYNSGQPIIQKKSQELIASVPPTFDFHLTKALCFSSNKDWMPHDDEEFSATYDKQRQQANTLWDKYAREYVTRIPDPRDMLLDLENRLSIIRSLGLPNDPHLFLNKLAEVDYMHTLAICRTIVADNNTSMTHVLVSFLLAVRTQKPDEALKVYSDAIGSHDSEMRYAAVRYLASTCLNMPTDEEIAILDELFRHSDEKIVLQALEGAQWYGMTNPEYLVNKLTDFDIGGRSLVAARICECALYNAKLESFADEQLAQIVLKLQPVPLLTGESVSRFLHAASQRVPEAVLDLYLSRILHEQHHPGTGFDALPHNMYSITVDPRSDRYEVFLYRIRDLALHCDTYSRWDLAKVYAKLSHGFDSVSLAVLTEWVDTKEEEKIAVVIDLLREAQVGMIFSQVPFIAHLLEVADQVSPMLHDMAVVNLTRVALSGVRTGTPGEPNQQDLYVESEARKAAQQSQKGSVQERFYTKIAESTRRDIELHLKLDEELFT